MNLAPCTFIETTLSGTVLWLREPGLNVLCAHCSLTKIELINIMEAFQLMCLTLYVLSSFLSIIKFIS